MNSRNIKIYIYSLFSIALLFMVLSLSYSHIREIDRVLSGIIYNFSGDYLLQFFILFTELGSYKFSIPFLIVLILILTVKKKLWLAFSLFFNLIGVRILNYTLKSFFAFERPTVEHLVHASYYTFPSGHTMNTFSFFGFICYLVLYHQFPNKKWSYFLVILLSTFIFLVGLSRVYLGVHFLLDVIGGFLAGLFWLILSVFLYRTKINV